MIHLAAQALVGATERERRAARLVTNLFDSIYRDRITECQRIESDRFLFEDNVLLCAGDMVLSSRRRVPASMIEWID